MQKLFNENLFAVIEKRKNKNVRIYNTPTQSRSTNRTIKFCSQTISLRVRGTTKLLFSTHCSQNIFSTLYYCKHITIVLSLTHDKMQCQYPCVMFTDCNTMFWYLKQLLFSVNFQWWNQFSFRKTAVCAARSTE